MQWLGVLVAERRRRLNAQAQWLRHMLPLVGSVESDRTRRLGRPFRHSCKRAGQGAGGCRGTREATTNGHRSPVLGGRGGRQDPAVGMGRAPRRRSATSRWVKRTRRALLKDQANLRDSQLAVPTSCAGADRCSTGAGRSRGLRDLYRLADPANAPAHLDWWLAWAWGAASPPSSPSCGPTVGASSPPSSSVGRL